MLWVPWTRDIVTELSDAVGVASGTKRVPLSEELVVAAVSGQVVVGVIISRPATDIGFLYPVVLP